jgi:hypothetical protein
MNYYSSAFTISFSLSRPRLFHKFKSPTKQPENLRVILKLAIDAAAVFRAPLINQPVVWTENGKRKSLSQSYLRLKRNISLC